MKYNYFSGVLVSPCKNSCNAKDGLTINMKINPMIAQQYPLQLNEEKIAHLLREFLSETNRKTPENPMRQITTAAKETNSI